MADATLGNLAMKHWLGTVVFAAMAIVATAHAPAAKAESADDRFKAIYAGAGLSNWISYYGTNGINTWMIPYFGKTMYEDQKAYWDVSAIQFIDRAKTPTLIAVGERDIEVPPTQSVEYWNALKAYHVPTSLVIYPDEGHGFRDLAHIADLQHRIVGWFDRYLSRR